MQNKEGEKGYQKIILIKLYQIFKSSHVKWWVVGSHFFFFFFCTGISYRIGAKYAERKER